MSSEAETTIVSSYNPEEWLASSGKKFSRYYFKTQGPIKFKMGKISGPGVGNGTCGNRINEFFNPRQRTGFYTIR